MEEKFNQLKSLVNEISDLEAAQALLNWDHRVYMPDGGAEDRGCQLSTLARIAFQRATSSELGQLLQDLEPYAAQLPADSDEACLIRRVRRDYNQLTRLPEAWVVEFTSVVTSAQTVWAQAKATSNFASFNPNWKKWLKCAASMLSSLHPLTMFTIPCWIFMNQALRPRT